MKYVSHKYEDQVKKLHTFNEICFNKFLKQVSKILNSSIAFQCLWYTKELIFENQNSFRYI